jgi:hypothetical protein
VRRSGFARNLLSLLPGSTPFTSISALSASTATLPAAMRTLKLWAI